MDVSGNTSDPAAPYQGAVGLSRGIGNARLLTLNGYGHGVLGIPSVCVQQAMTRYLVNLELPAPGPVCQQDVGPFDGPTPGGPAAAIRSLRPLYGLPYPRRGNHQEQAQRGGD